MCGLTHISLVLLALEYADKEVLLNHLRDNYKNQPDQTQLAEAMATADKISAHLGRLLTKNMNKAELAKHFKSKLQQYVSADDDELNRIISKAMYNAQARHG